MKAMATTAPVANNPRGTKKRAFGGGNTSSTSLAVSSRTIDVVRDAQAQDNGLSNNCATRSNGTEAKRAYLDSSSSSKRIRIDSCNSTFAYFVDASSDAQDSLYDIKNGSEKPAGLLRAFSYPSDIENITPVQLTPRGPLMAKVDVSDLTGVFSNSRRATLTFYLFPSCIEVSKRSKHSVQGTNRGLIMLSSIRRIIDVTGCGNDIHLFCLTIRHNIFGDNSCAFLFRGSVCDSNPNFDGTNEDKRLFLAKLSTCVSKATGRTVTPEDYEGSLPDEGELGLVVGEAVKRVEADQRALSESLRTVRRSTSRLVRQVVDNVVSVGRSNSMRASFPRSKGAVDKNKVNQDVIPALEGTCNDSRL